MDAKKHLSNQIRIIGGQWRSRKITFAPVAGLRPTGDRIRETLFNWLSPYIVEARCLDLFAGSGALGFEALSRGAQSVLFVDANRDVIQFLNQNATKLACSQMKAIQKDALHFLQHPPEKPFSIIFLDPPFDADLLSQCAEYLEQCDWLTQDALIYVESDKKLASPKLPGNWEVIKNKIAGQVRFQLIKRGLFSIST